MYAKQGTIFIIILLIISSLYVGCVRADADSNPNIHITIGCPGEAPYEYIERRAPGSSAERYTSLIEHRVTEIIDKRVGFLRGEISSRLEEVQQYTRSSSGDLEDANCGRNLRNTLLLMPGKVARKVGSNSVCQFYSRGCSANYLDGLEDDWYAFQFQFNLCLDKNVTNATLIDTRMSQAPSGAEKRRSLKNTNLVSVSRPSSGNWSLWAAQCTERTNSRSSIGIERAKWIRTALNHKSLEELYVLHDEVSQHLRLDNKTKVQLEQVSDQEYRKFQEQFRQALSYRTALLRMQAESKLGCSLNISIPSFFTTSHTDASGRAGTAKQDNSNISVFVVFSSKASSPKVVQLYTDTVSMLLASAIRLNEFFNKYFFRVVCVCVGLWVVCSGLVDNEMEFMLTSKAAHIAASVQIDNGRIPEKVNEQSLSVYSTNHLSNTVSRIDGNSAKGSSSGMKGELVLKHCEQLWLHFREQRLSASIARMTFILTAFHLTWSSYLLYTHLDNFYFSFFSTLLTDTKDDEGTIFFWMNFLGSAFKVYVAQSTTESLMNMAVMIGSLLASLITFFVEFNDLKNEAELVIKKKEIALDTENNLFLSQAENRPAQFPMVSSTQKSESLSLESLKPIKG